MGRARRSMWLPANDKGEGMMEENYVKGPTKDKRYMRRAIDQLAIGSIIVLWGSLLTLKQAGIIAKDISTLPFVFLAFGIMLVVGGIYRLFARDTPALQNGN